MMKSPASSPSRSFTRQIRLGFLALLLSHHVAAESVTEASSAPPTANSPAPAPQPTTGAYTRAAGTMSAGSAQKSIDGRLKEFSHAFQPQEAWERYRDDETAVLEPGLSPEQRHVLFGAALEKLDLPLVN